MDNEQWASEQLTKEQAMALYESNIWAEWDTEKKVRTQLFQKRLCMPFDKFHEAMEKVLNRPVYTHEFGDRHKLVLEYLGDRPAPTFQEIIDIIPADKRLIVGI